MPPDLSSTGTCLVSEIYSANEGCEMGKLVAAMAALVIAILLVYNGLWPNYRTKVNGPESTIGKSGEMKSPGGSTETGERRL
jgi:hypothetical protein